MFQRFKKVLSNTVEKLYKSLAILLYHAYISEPDSSTVNTFELKILLPDLLTWTMLWGTFSFSILIICGQTYFANLSTNTIVAKDLELRWWNSINTITISKITHEIPMKWLYKVNGNCWLNGNYYFFKIFVAWFKLRYVSILSFFISTFSFIYF